LPMQPHNRPHAPRGNMAHGMNPPSPTGPTLAWEIRALRSWSTAGLLAAKEWWLSRGMEMGTRDALNNVAAIDYVLRGR